MPEVPSGPFSERVLNAVGGCTRALGGTPDAARGLDRSEAATLGALRAYGDRLALRGRFHDDRVHHRHRPDDGHAATVYDALEEARLDALGVEWLEGVAHNLLASPVRDDSGARWLAFEFLTGRAAPAPSAAAVAALRARLSPELVEQLGALRHALRDQAAFAAGAAGWTAAAAGHVLLPAGSPGGSRVPLPTRYVERYQRRDASQEDDETGARPPGAEERGQSGAAGGSGTAAPGASGDAAAAGYRVFTTSHDRVVQAAALATREELAQLHAELEDELATVRVVVARLAKRLLRVLMARQVRQWRFDLEEGLLDSSRLASVVASPESARPFKEETESRFPATVVSLLIDHSGSMSGRPMRIAALTVEIFARVLERCGVRCEVLGFTTREWDGGEPAREWAARGYPENPGRLNALEHIVIKDADVPWRRARVGLGLFLHDEMLKENIDGEAVAWAHGRLMGRAERRRILVVISDGAPMDEATLAANGFDYLDHHLLTVVEGIEERSRVQVAAIGIGHDVSGFYRNASIIRDIDELGPALTRKLVALLGEEDHGRRRKRTRSMGGAVRR